MIVHVCRMAAMIPGCCCAQQPQDAEKARQFRSRLIEILNGDPAASPLGGAHRLGAPYSSHRTPEGTPPVSTRLRPCWTAFLSLLRGAHSYCSIRADY